MAKAAPAKKAPVRRKAPAKKPARKSASTSPLRKRWLLPALSLALFGAGFARFIFWYGGEQHRDLHAAVAAHPGAARARILERVKRKGWSVHYLFEYKGQVYDEWQSDYDGDYLLRGCYEVRFDSLRPVRSFLVPGTAGACAGVGAH